MSLESADGAGPTAVVFETHATSLDNEAGIASGWFDADLSPTGERQARELGARRAGDRFAAVYCSDLRRSRRTAEIAFGSGAPIVEDARLRECNYGDLTRAPAADIERQRLAFLTTPFPRGESYEDVVRRVRACLRQIAAAHAGDAVLIIGHRATFYAVAHLLGATPLADIVSAPWTWRPGWRWEMDNAERRT